VVGLFEPGGLKENVSPWNAGFVHLQFLDYGVKEGGYKLVVRQERNCQSGTKGGEVR